MIKEENTQEQIDELTDSLSILSDKIASANSDFLSVKNKPVVISIPVPFETRESINTLLVYPVCATLPGTSAATAANYGYFYTAPFDCYVDSVRVVYKTLGSDAGAVTLQIESLTGTTALGSGTALLDSAISLKQTAATVYSGALLLAGASGNKFVINTNNRLALKLSGTPTAVDSLQVTVGIKPL